MVSVVNDTMLGQTCTFRSKNTSDTITYVGIIQAGAVTSVIAQNYTDLVAYNAAVRQVDPAVSDDVTTLSYFILTLSNTTTKEQRAFSSDWILDGSFSIVSQDVTVTVIVYDSNTADHTGILTALRAAGYSCYLQSVNT